MSDSAPPPDEVGDMFAGMKKKKKSSSVPPFPPLPFLLANRASASLSAKKVVFDSDDVPSEPTAAAPVADSDDLDFSDLKKKKKKKVVIDEGEQEVKVKKVDRMGNELVEEVVVVEKVVEEEGGDEFSDLKKKKKKVRFALGGARVGGAGADACCGLQGGKK